MLCDAFKLPRHIYQLFEKNIVQVISAIKMISKIVIAFSFNFFEP
jgi:hypothetical protein